MSGGVVAGAGLRQSGGRDAPPCGLSNLPPVKANAPTMPLGIADGRNHRVCPQRLNRCGMPFAFETITWSRESGDLSLLDAHGTCATTPGSRTRTGRARPPRESDTTKRAIAEDIARSKAFALLNSRDSCSHDSLAPLQFQPSVPGPPKTQRSVYLGAALLPALS